jgi:septum formation protein
MRLILASASPRRAELLRAAGFDFDVIATDVDERVPTGETPERYVRRLAAEKSGAVLAGLSGGVLARLSGAVLAGVKSCATGAGSATGQNTTERQNTTEEQKVAQGFSSADVLILGADTAVVVDGEILGKPRNNAESAAMIRRLAGRRHDVLTGVSLRRGAFEIGRVESTAVFFGDLSDDEVAWYVGSGEGRDKAGAYAVQGLASRFVTRIEGSYSNVVGLPIACVVELLREIGFFTQGC